MAKYQQQKGDPGVTQRPDSGKLHMTWARQLFSTKLAWDNYTTQFHADNTIKEVFEHLPWPFQLNRHISGNCMSFFRKVKV